MARARSALLALRKLFGDSSRPICLVDRERRIQYANKSLASWSGVDADVLVGQCCVYHGEGEANDAAQVAAGLAPPPECFLGQELERIVVLHRDGADRIRRATFLPLSTMRTSRDRSNLPSAVIPNM